MPTETGVSDSSSLQCAIAIVEAVDMKPTSSAPCAIRRPYLERAMYDLSTWFGDRSPVIPAKR